LDQNSAPRASITSGQYTFHYAIEECDKEGINRTAVCYLALCDNKFPQRTAHAYLENLIAEFDVSRDELNFPNIVKVPAAPAGSPILLCSASQLNPV
jgi:hypothetical protein